MAKPNKQTLAQEILDALKKAGETGIRSKELLATHGTCAKSRIGDLRRKGWNIDTEGDEDGEHGRYILVSLEKGPARRNTWGLRVTARGPMATASGYTADVLDPGLSARIATRIQELLSEDPELRSLVAEGRALTATATPPVVQARNCEPAWLDTLMDLQEAQGPSRRAA